MRSLGVLLQELDQISEDQMNLQLILIDQGAILDVLGDTLSSSVGTRADVPR